MLIRQRRRSDPNGANGAILFYLTVAAAMWLLALGPRPSFIGKPLAVYGPYGALMHLPGFDEMRVPARLWMLSVLSLSAAAALIVGSVRSAALRRTVVTVAIAGLLLDGWPRTFALAAAPALRPPVGTPAVARLGLPLARNETESMYQTIGDGLPVFNGYSGYDAPQHAALRDLLERRDPAILATLAASGPIQIVVERELDPDDGWRRYVEQAGARLLDSGPGWSRYELSRQPRDPLPTVAGRPLPIANADASVNVTDVNAMFDGDLNTRWHAPQQAGDETVTIDLGTPQQVGWVELCLGTYASQYPRALVAEASLDGQSWTEVWAGRTALATYDAAVTNPRAIPIPLRIRRAARFLRLRQVANDPTRVWTIVELRVLAE
jgi:hypothetical protein